VPDQPTNLRQLFELGGPMMWPLLCVSILTLGTVLERLIFLVRRGLERDPKTLDQFFAAFIRGDTEDAIHVSKASKFYVVRALGYALAHNHQSLTVALRYASKHEIRRFRRGTAFLDLVVLFAPLVGFLGTLTRVFELLASINAEPMELNKLSAITSGIGQALVPTIFGLGIAITTLLPTRLIKTRASEASDELEFAAAQLELSAADSSPAAPAILSALRREETESAEINKTRASELSEEMEFVEAQLQVRAAQSSPTAPAAPPAVRRMEAESSELNMRRESRESVTGSYVAASDSDGGVAERPHLRISPLPESLVRFSAFAPPTVVPDSEFVLNIWAYLWSQRGELQSGANVAVGTLGPVCLPQGAKLEVRVEIAAFAYRSIPESLAWAGVPANAAFRVRVPGVATAGRYLGEARISFCGVRVAKLVFELTVGSDALRSTELQTREERVRSVFASYANEDRIEALKVKRALEPLDIDVFVDVMDLRAGDNWENELWKQIPLRDRFYLLWSVNAARSAWVEKEWRCALDKKGLDCIEPISLADPRDAPPPPELASLHFNSLARIAIEYEQGRGG
jgi:biopolymer transport protein ExbB